MRSVALGPLHDVCFDFLEEEFLARQTFEYTTDGYLSVWDVAKGRARMESLAMED